MRHGDFKKKNNKSVVPLLLLSCIDCIYIYIYVWKLNQTVLELDLWAVKFCSSLDGIWTHTIDTLQHQSLSLMSNALDLSTTSAILKYNFNSRSVTLSRKENLEIDIRHVSKRV
jgi:hypothetical protein